MRGPLLRGLKRARRPHGLRRSQRREAVAQPLARPLDRFQGWQRGAPNLTLCQCLREVARTVQDDLVRGAGSVPVRCARVRIAGQRPDHVFGAVALFPELDTGDGDADGRSPEALCYSTAKRPGCLATPCGLSPLPFTRSSSIASRRSPFKRRPGPFDRANMANSPHASARRRPRDAAGRHRDVAMSLIGGDDVVAA